MKTFGFDFLAPDGQIHSVDLGEFASVAEATGYARRVLTKSLTAVAVDVWCEGEHVERLDRAPPHTPHGDGQTGAETA